MKNRSSLAGSVLCAGLSAGILGDALLRATPWGINVFVWVGALVAMCAAIIRWQEITLQKRVRWAAATALLFAGGFAWRDSAVLKVLDALAIALSFSVISLRSGSGRARTAGLIEYAAGAAVSAFNALFGVFPLSAGLKREP